MTLTRYLAIAAGLAVFAGCDATTGERLMAPSASAVGSSTSNVAKTKNLGRGNRSIGLVLPTGGSISVGDHTLKVPAGAVSQPTWFSLQVVEAAAVHVKLKAWRALDGAAVTQFPNVPVQLTLNVKDLEKLDPTGLVIVYLRDGTYWGAREPVPTTVDTNSWTVTGYLTHFSQYAVAREFSPGID